MKKIIDWRAIFSIAARTCFLFAVAFLLSPSSVDAQCGQWDISGDWEIVIAKGPSEKLKLTQSGTKVSGKGTTTSMIAFTGEVTGQLQGDKVILYVQWRSPDLGPLISEFFDGTIGPDGKIGGQGHIFVLAGGLQVDWSSDRPMKCIKLIKRVGKRSTTPTTVIVPMITASQTNLVIPIGQSGQTVLTWDGGKDHPYAEVWVKVDDGEETFVVEQGKGTRQVTVERGRTYLYILSDAGKRLATVTVNSRQ